MSRFSTKVVLVAGVASRIGDATARRFDEEVASLALAELNGKDQDRVVAGIGDGQDARLGRRPLER